MINLLIKPFDNECAAVCDANDAPNSRGALICYRYASHRSLVRDLEESPPVHLIYQALPMSLVLMAF